MSVDKSIFGYLNNRFSSGIEYTDAVQICLGLYVVDSLIPEVNQEDCTIDIISETFQKLAKEGKIVNYCSRTATLYGARYHDYRDKGHWVEIIASIFKKGSSVDHSKLAEIGIVAKKS